MAEHLHTQIVNKVADVLRDSVVPSINGTVFPYRVYPANVADLPYGSVWAPHSEVHRESGDGGSDDLVEEVVDVMVALFFEGEESTLEGLMNQGMLEAQVALAGGVVLSGGDTIVGLDFRGCEKTMERGDLPYGEVQLKFGAEICYARGDPTRLAWL